MKITELSITTLSENTAGMGNFLAEAGLSILLEARGMRVLLDTGKGISTCHNADSLGVDLTKLDKIVLSHGHLDHTGGLRQVLRRIERDIEVIAHPDVWADKYNRRKGRKERFIGVPFQRQELESHGAVFRLSTGPVKIADDILTTGEVPRVTDFEDMPTHLMVREGSRWRRDELKDDQALVIDTEQGLFVILGCAHRGIINTLYHARQLTGVARIHTVVGGAHLLDASEERVSRTIAVLKELDVQRLGLCHCTSLPAASIIAHEFGDRFFFNNAGNRIELP
ncbi:MBL fold metallo-hydrolase [Chloroflexota bacterium]